MLSAHYIYASFPSCLALYTSQLWVFSGFCRRSLTLHYTFLRLESLRHRQYCDIVISSALLHPPFHDRFGIYTLHFSLCISLARMLWAYKPWGFKLLYACLATQRCPSEIYHCLTSYRKQSFWPKSSPALCHIPNKASNIDRHRSLVVSVACGVQ